MCFEIVYYNSVMSLKDFNPVIVTMGQPGLSRAAFVIERG